MSYFSETKKNENQTEYKEYKVGRIIGAVIFGLFAFIVFWGSFGFIGAGERGVHLRFGAVTGKVFQPGLYFKLPIVDEVISMDVQIQKEETKAEAASQDLQTVDTDIAINYHLRPDTAMDVYRTIGVDYAARVIDPALQEAVKSVTAQYTAEQLVTRREDVRQGVLALIGQKLSPHGIDVDALNIVNFKFSDSFEQAIENKVTTEQNALAAKNKLQQVQYEAEQTVVAAKGQAQAIQIQAQAIQSQGGAEYVRLQAVNKWDGKLPNYMLGNSVPFINVNQSQ